MFAVQADGGRGHDRRGLADGAEHAPAAGGVLGAPGPAVRLLHAGDADDRARAARAQPAARRGRRSARRCRATCAAARATSTSSTRSRSVGGEQRWPLRPHQWIGARPQAPRGPGAADRRGDLRQRLRAAGDAARRGAAQPACRTPASCRSTHRARAELEGVLAVLTGAELAEIDRRRCRGSARRRSSSTRSRSTRSATPARRSRSPWPRRATWPRTRSTLVEVDYEPLRAARRRGRGGEAGRRRSCTTTSGLERRLREDVHARRRRGRLRARRARRAAARCAGRARRRRRWSPPARSATSTRATGRMDVHSNSNMLNFAAWVLSATLQTCRPSCSTSTRCTRAGASAPSTCRPRRSRSRARWRKLTRPAGEVHGGPRGQPPGQRLAGARPPLRGRAGDRRRRPLPLGETRRGRRLRRLLHVRRRRQHEPDGADHRPVRDRLVRVRRQGRADQQEPAGRVPRRGLGRRQLGARAARRRGRRGARDRRRRAAPAQPDPARPVPVQDPDRQRLRLGRLPGGAGQGAGARRARLLARRAGARARAGPLHRDRARAAPSSARPTPRPSSGSTTRARTSACRRRPRACASASARPAA